MTASACESPDRKCARGALGAVVASLVLAVVALISLPGEALALKAIVVGPDQGRLEITTLGELYDGRGDSLQVETAAGEDGVVGRMSVSATTQGTNPNWIVFALTNPTDKPVERWLSADRYNVVGSGVVWPDLDARRIEAVTPSIGFVPERIKSDRADVFRITLEPGQTITYVAELSSERFARIYLWKPLDYELKSSDRQLFNGVMLGLTGLMAIFLTAIFAANHKLMFPASALVAWCVLAYLCVDFGFFHKLFQMKPEANAVYRAGAESALAASLVVFLHVFLRLALWHGLIRMLITVWLMAQFSLIAVAIVDPRLASTFARLSFVFIGGTGAGLILYLAFRGQDRALSLIPTWILFLVWIFGAGVTLTGKLSGDIVVSGLVAGLVLVLLLIGFTVTQYAFRSLEPMYSGAPSELQLKSVAVDAAGAAVWEWNARRDSVKCSPLVEGWLGLHAGELSARVDEFLRHLHQADRERFRLALSSVQERGDGKIHCDFRMRQADNSYRWFELEAAGVPGSDPRSFKCVGLMRDVTDTKRAHERLLHDAVHDSLTGLPNRELLLDRLEVAMARAKSEAHIRPAVVSINIDKFKSMNSSFGLVLGDSLLLTIARRLQRHLGPNDTLSRIGGDQFAILIPGEQPPQELAAHAERIRRSLRSPIKIAAQEIVLTGSLGVAVYDGTEAKCEELLKKAEIAMYRAKRGGADRIEVFGRQMKVDWDERVALESDLRKALEKNQLRVLYQPIVYLPTEELAGFEAVIRWDHPQLGVIDPWPSSRSPRIRISSSSSARMFSCARPAMRHAGRRSIRESTRRSSFPSTSRAGSSSARTSFRRSGTFSGATSCRRVRSSSRSPSSSRWRTRSRRPRSWNGCAAPAPRSRSTTSAWAIRRSPISSGCRSTRSRSTRRSCSRAAPAAGRRSCARSLRWRTSSARRWSRRASRTARRSRSCARSDASTRKAAIAAIPFRTPRWCRFSRCCAAPRASSSRAAFSAPSPRRSGTRNKTRTGRAENRRSPPRPTGRIRRNVPRERARHRSPSRGRRARSGRCRTAPCACARAHSRRPSLSSKSGRRARAGPRRRSACFHRRRLPSHLSRPFLPTRSLVQGDAWCRSDAAAADDGAASSSEAGGARAASAADAAAAAGSAASDCGRRHAPAVAAGGRGAAAAARAAAVRGADAGRDAAGRAAAAGRGRSRSAAAARAGHGAATRRAAAARLLGPAARHRRKPVAACGQHQAADEEVARRLERD